MSFVRERKKHKKSFGALAISGIYFIFGFLWIFFSDRIALQFVSDDISYAQVQTWKGWVYVFVTTLLIYWLLKIYISRKNRALADLKLKEAELEENLREKEILLSEVHHRVKNNLQMINSLILLKEQSLGGSSRDPLVDKIIEQLYSLSAVHETIYESSQDARINAREFLTDIAESMQGRYNLSGNIRLELHLDDITLTLEKAVPFGLFVSEALSNAFKHAFPNGGDGNLTIYLNKTPDTFRLVIEDTGSGFDSADYSGTFGLSLMQNLAVQLEAEMAIVSSPGLTRISLK